MNTYSKPSQASWVFARQVARRSVQNVCRIMPPIMFIGIGIFWLASTPTLADQAGLQKVQQALRTFRADHGRTPTDLDLMSLATAPGVSLACSEYPSAWKELARLQKNPTITADDLATLTVSKRASIQDMRESYKYRQEKLDATGRVIAYSDQRITRVIAGNRMRLDVDESSHGLDGRPARHRVSKTYDGRVVRMLDYLPNGSMHGSIMPLGGVSSFMPPHDVLWAGMLEDSKARWGYSFAPADLAEFLGTSSSIIVLEDAEDVGGSKCLVVVNGVHRVYLDISRDFSVIRFDEWTPMRNEVDATVYPGQELTIRRHCRDLRDYGNGVWLPRQIEVLSYKHGKVVERHTSLIESLEINKEIPGSVFTDLLPEGILVSDLVRKAVYRSGNEPSIEDTLSKVTMHKARRRRWLLVLNVVAIVILVAVYARRRHMMKRRLVS
jgi:hypothetical protein